MSLLNNIIQTNMFFFFFSFFLNFIIIKGEKINFVQFINEKRQNKEGLKAAKHRFLKEHLLKLSFKLWNY